MSKRTRILFLSANPWTTSRILVDEEAREIFEKLQQGASRDRFELLNHAATRAVDLQRLLMTYTPDIVHFSTHGSKKQKLILGGTPGRGKEVDRSGLVDLFALYRKHVRLVFLNACFTKTQAQSLCQVVDYSVGTGKMIGDKSGVAFAGAFYRALSFGKSVRDAFQSAKVELGLTKMPRSNGLELFVRDGLSRDDSFPKTRTRGKRRRPERQTTTRTPSDVGCVAGRCGGLLSHYPLLSPRDSLARGLEPTRVRDAAARHEGRFEHVSWVRAEAIVSHRYSGEARQTRPRTALKKIRKLDAAGRGSNRRKGKELSSISLVPTSATATLRVLRVVSTESFELVVNNLKKE